MSKKRQRNKRARARKKARAQKRPAFTIDPAAIEKEVLDRAGEYAVAIERVVAAGMKLLFSDQTHSTFFDSIRPQDEVPLADELGAGAFHAMMILYNESKQTMPPQAFIPAGTILLAKACEFINRTKLAPITDKDFADAVEMFTAVTKREALRNEQGQQAQPAMQGAQQPQGAPQPPAGGVLNQTEV